MTYSIYAPERLDASLQLPPSKSISNRALIINALAGGTVDLVNLSACDDTSVMVAALRRMPELVDIGAAGTAMRFLTAYLSVAGSEHVITGTERMRKRPIGPLVDALRYLGADIEYEGEEGYPPLRIRGRKLMGGRVEMPANVSSQYVSALLMIGPAMKKGLELHLDGEIVSRPYIDLTLHVMHDYGAEAEWSDVDTITIKPRPYVLKPYKIESDWSSASYWYEAMALYSDPDSHLHLGGLHDGSRQGDSVVRYIFSLLGVKTAFSKDAEGNVEGVELSRHFRTLPRLDYDFTGSPDLAQTLVAGCCAMNIPFHFKGLGSLRIKETDRIVALERELMKIGYMVSDIDGREMVWDGKRCAASMKPFDTYDDHRMAMAFAPLAIVFPGIKINNPEVVSKSYPKFWDDLRNAGFNIIEEE